jgi:hypothetical protein
VAGLRGRDYLEEARYLARPVEGADLLRYLLVVEHRLVEARRLARAEYRRERVERGLVLRVGRDGVPRDVYARELDAVFQLFAYLSVERGQRDLRAHNRLALRDGAEILLDHLSRLYGVEVAGDDEARVVRDVVVSEEALHVVERRGRQIFHRADGRPVVRVALRVHRLVYLVGRLPVRLVVYALALLVLHHVALVVELRLRHCFQEALHATGLHEERGLKEVRRH